MKIILLTVIVAFVVAFLLGLLLGLFSKIFAVKVDPKISAIREVLSGGNCGGCGFAGCDAFAAAVVRGEAFPRGWVGGGPSVAKKVAEILGVESGSGVSNVAFLACAGTKECAKNRGEYNGIKTCKAAQQAINGTKLCAFGCIGYGDCVEACPFNALSMGEDGIPHVDCKKCVGCGKCVKECPKHLFSLIDSSVKGSIAKCSNRSDNKPSIKKNCSAGCIKCGICEKKCPEHCIVVTKGIPVVDYSKCTSCGECIKACPDKVLHLAQEIIGA